MTDKPPAEHLKDVAESFFNNTMKVLKNIIEITDKFGITGGIQSTLIRTSLDQTPFDIFFQQYVPTGETLLAFQVIYRIQDNLCRSYGITMESLSNEFITPLFGLVGQSSICSYRTIMTSSIAKWQLLTDEERSVITQPYKESYNTMKEMLLRQDHEADAIIKKFENDYGFFDYELGFLSGHVGIIICSLVHHPSFELFCSEIINRFSHSPEKALKALHGFLEATKKYSYKVDKLRVTEEDIGIYLREVNEAIEKNKPEPKRRKLNDDNEFIIKESQVSQSEEDSSPPS